MLLRKSGLPLALSLMVTMGLSGCELSDVEAASPEAADASNTGLNPATAIAFDWLKVSGWHTQGMIPRNSPIRVAFNRDVVSADMVGQSADKVMTLSPAVPGKATFVSTTEIVLIPDEPLKSGASYSVSISSAGLKDIPPSPLPTVLTSVLSPWNLKSVIPV